MYSSSVYLSFQYNLRAIEVAFNESKWFYRLVLSLSESHSNNALMLLIMKTIVFLLAYLFFQCCMYCSKVVIISSFDIISSLNLMSILSLGFSKISWIFRITYGNFIFSSFNPLLTLTSVWISSTNSPHFIKYSDFRFSTLL